jgi:NAD-dependent SIR2 family protein deacetylase
MPLAGASSSHRSGYEPTCTTCDNPFTTEENIREISLEFLQRSANRRSCEKCELLLRRTVLVFGEEYRKYANSNDTLNVLTGRLPGEDPRLVLMFLYNGMGSKRGRRI